MEIEIIVDFSNGSVTIFHSFQNIFNIMEHWKRSKKLMNVVIEKTEEITTNLQKPSFFHYQILELKRVRCNCLSVIVSPSLETKNYVHKAPEYNIFIF